VGKETFLGAALGGLCCSGEVCWCENFLLENSEVNPVWKDVVLWNLYPPPEPSNGP
jgi:hypothetical protein